jgi:hypothetical protein
LRDLGQNRNAHPHFRREVKFDVNGCRSMELAFFRAVERCTAVPIPFGNTDVWHHNQANTISLAFSVRSQMSLYMRHRSGYGCPRALIKSHGFAIIQLDHFVLYVYIYAIET